MPLHRIVTAYAAFGVVTDDNGTVVEAAPIGRRFIGRSLREVNRRVIELRGAIEQLPERTPQKGLQPHPDAAPAVPEHRRVWHGELVSDETGIVVWTCPHDHLNAETAKRCALTRAYGCYPPSLRRQQPANQRSIA